MKRRFTYWPFLLDPPDRPIPRPEDEYGPITDETVQDIDITFEQLAEGFEPETLLPEPPEGCYWGLVGMVTVNDDGSWR